VACGPYRLADFIQTLMIVIGSNCRDWPMSAGMPVELDIFWNRRQQEFSFFSDAGLLKHG